MIERADWPHLSFSVAKIARRERLLRRRQPLGCAVAMLEVLYARLRVCPELVGLTMAISVCSGAWCGLSVESNMQSGWCRYGRGGTVAGALINTEHGRPRFINGASIDVLFPVESVRSEDDAADAKP